MYTDKEQYQLMVGTKFYHKDDTDLIYSLGEVNEEGEATVINGEGDIAEYKISKALELVREGYWIVVD